jgi:hypothetical protein
MEVDLVRSLVTLIMLFLVFEQASVVAAQPVMREGGGRRTGGPELAVEHTAYDFGRVPLGNAVTATFPVMNRGEEALELYPYFVENSPLSLQVSDASLLPGASGRIEVTLNTEGLFGEVSDSLPVYTNDPEHRECYFRVTAYVFPYVIPYPAVVDMGKVPKGDSVSGTVSLAGELVEENRLSGLRLEPSTESVRAKIVTRQMNGLVIPTLEFVLLPELKPGKIEETIAIVSENPPARAYLRIFGEKEGNILVTPERLMIVQHEDEKAGEHSLTIQSEKPFHIMGVEDPTHLLDLSTRTIEAESKYELVARMKDPEADKGAMGVVRVHTDMADQPLLEIPVIIAVIP